MALPCLPVRDFSPGMAAAISKHAFPSSCTVLAIILILAPIHRPAPARQKVMVRAEIILDERYCLVLDESVAVIISEIELWHIIQQHSSRYLQFFPCSICSARIIATSFTYDRSRDPRFPDRLIFSLHNTVKCCTILVSIF